MTDKFDPTKKIIKMQGKDYLPVNWRIFWFRSEHPKGAIITEVAGDGLMKATVIDEDGKVLGTGHGTPKMMGVAKARPFEGSETAAIGRALAHAGYGTQFTGEEEGEHLADAPVEKTSNVIITDKLWSHFQEVTNKAVRLGVSNVKTFERNKTTKEEVTAYGIELNESIKQIEAQNKAGE